MKTWGVAVGLILAAGLVHAGEVEVVAVEIRPGGGDLYRFDVTLRHGDTGWDHYADRWEVLAPDGTVLATRVLYHPHVDEQPFTRSLSDVPIPAELNEVVVRGHDSVHEYGGPERTVAVPR
jgi:hypothetical protein